MKNYCTVFICLIMLILLLFPYPAIAGTLSTGKKTTKSINKEKTQGIDMKQSDESETRRSSSISLSQIFFPAFSNLEKQGVEPFASCRIVSQPMLAGDLGYQFEFRPGLYDLTLKQIKDAEIAQNNRLSRDCNNMLVKYKNCMAVYGAIMAQGGLDMKSKVGGGAANDLVSFAEVISIKIVKSGIKNKTIKRVLSQIISEKGQCRYAGSAKDFICGSSMVSLGGDFLQRMTLAGMNIFAAEKPYGHNIEFSTASASKNVRDIMLSEKRSLTASQASESNAGMNAFSFIQK